MKINTLPDGQYSSLHRMQGRLVMAAYSIILLTISNYLPVGAAGDKFPPISRPAVSSTGHELHVMESKSLAVLRALTDKWGALEQPGPSFWAGEEKKEKGKNSPFQQSIFFLLLFFIFFYMRHERRLNTADSVCMVCFQNMRIINGFCGGLV